MQLPKGLVLSTSLTPYLAADIDILSTSAVHQGTGYVDFSLKIQPKSKA